MEEWFYHHSRSGSMISADEGNATVSIIQLGFSGFSVSLPLFISKHGFSVQHIARVDETEFSVEGFW